MGVDFLDEKVIVLCRVFEVGCHHYGVLRGQHGECFVFCGGLNPSENGGAP